MDRSGLDRRARLLLEQIGDILATECLISPGVFQGALDLFRTVDFAQGNDLLHVMARVAALFGQPLIILGGVRREGQEPAQQLLGTGLTALGEQFLHMLRFFEVPVPVITARVLGDELILVVEAQAVWTCSYQPLPRPALS